MPECAIVVVAVVQQGRSWARRATAVITLRKIILDSSLVKRPAFCPVLRLTLLATTRRIGYHFFMPRFILTVMCCLALATPAWAGFDEGMAAYQRGEYETALREFLPLAEQGDAAAQNNLGVMYDNGEGVPQDDAEAVRWYRKAAEHGNATAQYNLGDRYRLGLGVPQDDAVQWYSRRTMLRR